LILFYFIGDPKVNDLIIILILWEKDDTDFHV